MQLVKQLRSNANLKSRAKYWELLALCLHFFSPPSGADDIVHVFCKGNAPGGGTKYVSLMHMAMFGTPPPLCAPDELADRLSIFEGRSMRSKYSYREEAEALPFPTSARHSMEMRRMSAS